MMYRDFVRPMTAREQKLLKCNISKEERHLDLRHELSCLGGIFVATVVLWGVVGLLQRKMPSPIILVGMLVSYMGISVVASISERRKTRAKIRTLRQVLDKNEAREVIIQSDQMVQFEEEEDEGAEYAFQVDDDRVVLLSSQEYYPSRRFPNNDFSLIFIYDEKGGLVELLIDKRGEKLKPIRKISAKRKRELRFFNDLEVIEGKLEDLEKLLTE
jgi:hypothetical protein